LRAPQHNGAVSAFVADIDGIQLTELLKEKRPEIPVVLITAFGSVETAIEAMHKGAYHYVVKPFKLTELEATVSKALEFRALQKDNSALRMEVRKGWNFGNVIGKSDSMRRIYDLVSRIAGANSNVLITGESGTGKEMIAKAIHESGPRANKPFVAINCTAIPENLPVLVGSVPETLVMPYLLNPQREKWYSRLPWVV
jgi:DNA-binding NtrC family response regulator